MTDEELKVTIQEIHDNVYEQGKTDGRMETINEVFDLPMHFWAFDGELYIKVSDIKNLQEKNK